MDKSKLVKYISKIIFFGAIWGIVEATLGHVLHFIPATIAGTIMFPIAAFILVKAYKSIGSKSALLYIGIIAAGIKSVDFLLPGLTIYKTLNPMLSILLESVVVAVAYPLIMNNKLSKQVIGSIGASVAWRAVFIIYMIGQYMLTGNLAKYITSPVLAFNFVVISGIISGVMVMGALWILQKTENLKIRRLELKPVFALIALVFALGLQYMI